MVTLMQTRFRPSTLSRTRTNRVCRACGGQFATRPGEHLAGVFCPDCLAEHDDAVTAEHAWDLGGGD